METSERHGGCRALIGLSFAGICEQKFCGIHSRRPLGCLVFGLGLPCGGCNVILGTYAFMIFISPWRSAWWRGAINSFSCGTLGRLYHWPSAVGRSSLCFQAAMFGWANNNPLWRLAAGRQEAAPDKKRKHGRLRFLYSFQKKALGFFLLPPFEPVDN